MSKLVPKFNFNGSGHVYLHVDSYNEALKEAAWMIRHALGKDHPYSPISCGGCMLMDKFLKENPE
jgi:hypothetical protein